MWKDGLMPEPLLLSLLKHSAKAQECSAFPPQTLPELCSRQDELDFLMEALIIRCTPGQAGGCGGRQDRPTGMASPLFRTERQHFRAQRVSAL